MPEWASEREWGNDRARRIQRAAGTSIHLSKSSNRGCAEFQALHIAMAAGTQAEHAEFK
jgi:hypothetical protein